MFRKWTAIIYLPLAVCFQVIISITSFCVFDHTIGEQGDPVHCRNIYILTLGILLALHTVLDYLLYHFVVKETVASRIREHTKREYQDKTETLHCDTERPAHISKNVTKSPLKNKLGRIIEETD